MDDMEEHQKHGPGAIAILVAIYRMEKRIMSTLQEVLQDDADLTAEVETIGTDVTSALAALANVEVQLAALQGAGLTPEQQSQVDQIGTSIVAAKDSLAGVDASIQAAVPPASA